ncbi:MAG TPA: thioredoxin family protein [Acidobacteriota bacterium]|nr:thioredoxin family protein [Acidobacteriota bacterium]
MNKSPFAVIAVFLNIVLVPVVAAGHDLVGPTTREAILEHTPAWQEIIAAYQPKPEAIDKLRGLGREVRVEVYFGSWCSDSMAHVSALFKILDLADTPLLQPVYFGVPEAKEKRAPYLQGKDVVKLPTFIVIVDGRETGRIVETPKKSMEEDLVKILGL